VGGTGAPLIYAIALWSAAAFSRRAVAARQGGGRPHHRLLPRVRALHRPCAGGPPHDNCTPRIDLSVVESDQEHLDLASLRAATPRLRCLYAFSV